MAHGPMILFESVGFAVMSTRPLLPIAPSPVFGVKFTIAPLFAVRARLAKVRSADELPPANAAAGVDVMVERPCARVTAPTAWVSAANCRPLKVSVPPLSEMPAVETTRAELAARPVLFSSVRPA